MKTIRKLQFVTGKHFQFSCVQSIHNKLDGTQYSTLWLIAFVRLRSLLTYLLTYLHFTTTHWNWQSVITCEQHVSEECFSPNPSGSLPKFHKLFHGPYSTCSPNFTKSTHNFLSYSSKKQIEVMKTFIQSINIICHCYAGCFTDIQKWHHSSDVHVATASAYDSAANAEIMFLINVCIIRPHRSTVYVDVAYCYRPSSVVCRSVALVSPAKMAELIEMQFGLRKWVGPGNHVLDGGPDPPWKGANFWGENGRPIVKYRDTLQLSVQRWLNR